MRQNNDTTAIMSKSTKGVRMLLENSGTRISFHLSYLLTAVPFTMPFKAIEEPKPQQHSEYNQEIFELKQASKLIPVQSYPFLTFFCYIYIP